MDVVQRGKHVVLRDFEGNQKVVQIPLNGSEKLRFGKMLIPVSSIVGARYGSTFRLENNTWARRKPISLAIHDPQEGTIDTAVNNAELAQNNTAQALTHEEITDLKDAVTGEELVQKIVANSATFGSKTTFSQQKYIAKKQKKHIQQVTLMVPRLMDVCETYFLEGSTKTCSLRFDMLSSLLSQAGVGLGNGRCFVLDHTCGLVTGAVAQRLGGRGAIFRAFEKNAVSDRVVAQLDLPEESQRNIRNIPLFVLQSRFPWETDWLTEPVRWEKTNTLGKTDEQFEKRLEKRRLMWEVRTKEFKEFKEAPIDSMIACADDNEAFDAWFDAGFPRLVSCGTIGCYFYDAQKAMALYTKLRSDECFIFVKLQEFLLREFQIIHQRTHPLMNQNSSLFSGFLVSATKTNYSLPLQPPNAGTLRSVPTTSPACAVPPLPPAEHVDLNSRPDASPSKKRNRGVDFPGAHNPAKQAARDDDVVDKASAALMSPSKRRRAEDAAVSKDATASEDAVVSKDATASKGAAVLKDAVASEDAVVLKDAMASEDAKEGSEKPAS
eukprot:GEMP01020690.1.p1 GENE.GEMP01020690.1~~GEMP01020690.1.p1  ORF type:complete len:558 (+),score=152.81 GEMP01020690.1:22-1674(+)